MKYVIPSRLKCHILQEFSVGESRDDNGPSSARARDESSLGSRASQIFFLMLKID